MSEEKEEKEKENEKYSFLFKSDQYVKISIKASRLFVFNISCFV